MTTDFMTVEDALEIVYELADRNKLSLEQVSDVPELEAELLKQQRAIDVTSDFIANVVSEGRVQEIEPIREAPDGSSFMTLFVAYLFESPEQYRIYDEGETDLRRIVNVEYKSPVSLIAWNKRSGFPTPMDFDKFEREVSEELGDIPFVYPDEE